MPSSYRLGHRLASIPKGFTQQWQPTNVVYHHSTLHTPTIHSYDTPSFLLAQHSNLFSSSSHSWNLSTSSAFNLLSDYPDILPHTPFQQSYHSLYQPLSLLCIAAFSPPSILLTSSKPLRLFICTALILDLSFYLHIIVSLPYNSTGTSNPSCSTFEH